MYVNIYIVICFYEESDFIILLFSMIGIILLIIIDYIKINPNNLFCLDLIIISLTTEKSKKCSIIM